MIPDVETKETGGRKERDETETNRHIYLQRYISIYRYQYIYRERENKTNEPDR